MKSKQFVKIMVSLLSISIMFYGIYSVAYAYTFGTSAVVLPGTSAAALVTAPVKVVKSEPAVSVWTPKSLAPYNGLNGKPAYLAVDGVVYDVSKLATWKGGVHKGVKAGQDATAAFSNSPHVKSILKLAKTVGTYSSKEAVSPVVEKAAPVLVKAAVKSTAGVADAVTSATTKATANTTTKATIKATTNTTTKATDTKWTLTTLKQYNGIKGMPAYIAVSGVIYDVSSSSAWRSGSHKGVAAGQDVTKAFGNSPHAKSLLESLPVVAKLGDSMAPGIVTTATKVSTGQVSPVYTGVGAGKEYEYEDEDDDDDDHEHEGNEEDHDD